MRYDGSAMLNLSRRLLSAATLARWLGPWTPADATPGGVTVSTRALPSGLRVRRWAPRGRAHGGLLLIPGLHYDGPADHRMDRLARVLARAGALVVSPFIRDFLQLRLTPRVITDAHEALEALLDEPTMRRRQVGVFSVSFGSLPALHVAARAPRRDRVAGVALFGGYADFDETVRFAMTGEAPGAASLRADPLNRPVVYLNLLSHLTADPSARERLAAAWLAFCRATWGREEMKRGGAHLEAARAVADAHGLRGDALRLFLAGVGGETFDRGEIERALEAGREDLAYLDPRPLLTDVLAPVHALHGADDDVIPATHAPRLADAARSGRSYITGLYGHTGGSRGPLSRAPAAARELVTMARMLDAIAGLIHPAPTRGPSGPRKRWRQP